MLVSPSNCAHSQEKLLPACKAVKNVRPPSQSRSSWMDRAITQDPDNLATFPKNLSHKLTESQLSGFASISNDPKGEIQSRQLLL